MKEPTMANGRVIPNTEEIPYKTMEEIEAEKTPESLKRWRKLQADLLARSEAIKARRKLIATSENVVVFRGRPRPLDGSGALQRRDRLSPFREPVVIPFQVPSSRRQADQDQPCPE